MLLLEQDLPEMLHKELLFRLRRSYPRDRMAILSLGRAASPEGLDELLADGADFWLPSGAPERAVLAAVSLLQERLGAFADLRETVAQLRLAFTEAKDQLNQTSERLARAEAGQQQCEQRLGRLRQRFHRLIDANPSIIYANDARRDYRAIFVSRRAKEVLGYTPQEMLADPDFWATHIHPEDRERTFAEMHGLLGEGSGSLTYRFRDSGGSYHWIRDDFVVIRDGTGSAIEVVGTWSDITEAERQRAEIEALNRANTLLSQTMRAVARADSVPALLDACCRLAVDIGGYDLAWVGVPEQGLLRPAASAGQTDYLEGLTVPVEAPPGASPGPAAEAFRQGRPVIIPELDQERLLEHGRARAFGFHVLAALPLRGAGQITGVLVLYGRRARRFSRDESALLEDLAEEVSLGLARLERDAAYRESRARLEYLAYHVPLTRLPNRSHLLREVDARLQAGVEGLVLAVLDLARFREVNLVLGHDYGDRLLREIAGRLRERVDAGLFCAHLGASVFAILLEGVADAGEALHHVKQVVLVLLEPLSLGEIPVVPQCRAGVVLAPLHGDNAEVLLRRADLAKEAARKDPERIALFSEELERDPGRIAMLAELSRAIGSDQIGLHYQPRVELEGGAVHCVEALVRWTHPTLGEVPPSRFFPLVTQAGLTPSLSRQVVTEAVSQLAAWRASGLALKVAINITAFDLTDPAFLPLLTQALTGAGLTGDSLVLELTETAVIEHPQRTAQVLEALDQLGVYLAIDDFGTGHSSLVNLSRLPVRQLNIDRSFVTTLHESQANRAIVRSTIDLGHNLGLEVVAEEVESAGTLAELSRLGCDAVQGFHLCRPLPAPELEAWLGARHGAEPA